MTNILLFFLKGPVIDPKLSKRFNSGVFNDLSLFKDFIHLINNRSEKVTSTKVLKNAIGKCEDMRVFGVTISNLECQSKLRRNKNNYIIYFVCCLHTITILLAVSCDWIGFSIKTKKFKMIKIIWLFRVSVIIKCQMVHIYNIDGYLNAFLELIFPFKFFPWTLWKLRLSFWRDSLMYL